MSAAPTLQALAFFARDHFAEDGYPFEQNVPSSFDVIVGVYVDELTKWGEDLVRLRAGEVLVERLNARIGHTSVAQCDVEAFVEEVVRYLRHQYPTTEKALKDRLILSHLFWGNLVEARIARGPLASVACACGLVMIGQDDEDLYGLVRRHLVGQSAPEQHHPIELSESVARVRPVNDPDATVREVRSLKQFVK